MQNAYFPEGRILSRRFIRAGLVLLAGWLLLEIALLQLVAARIGWGLTLAVMTVKGGVGLLLIGFLGFRSLARLNTISDLRPGEASIRALFGIASGILITLPGLILSLVGIALFTPSLQRVILARFLAGSSKPATKHFDLDADEWQEIRRKKLATRVRSRKASLEAKPPSV